MVARMRALFMSPPPDLVCQALKYTALEGVGSWAVRRAHNGTLTTDPDAIDAHGFPTRRAFAWLAVAVVAFALYVSLLPFRLQPVPLGAAWDDFRLAMSSWPGRVPRVNFLANILLFVPVCFSLCGALRADRQRRLNMGALLVVLCSSVVESLTAEFIQELAPNR